MYEEVDASSVYRSDDGEEDTPSRKIPKTPTHNQGSNSVLLNDDFGDGGLLLDDGFASERRKTKVDI
jgi:hypothetical protein